MFTIALQLELVPEVQINDLNDSETFTTEKVTQHLYLLSILFLRGKNCETI